MYDDGADPAIKAEWLATAPGGRIQNPITRKDSFLLFLTMGD
jgi:hypothetical protein